MLKKLMDDVLLMTLFLPWAIWVTISLFASDKANAVQQTKYETIIEKIEELKKVVEKKIHQ